MQELEVFVINGSASQGGINKVLIDIFTALVKDSCIVICCNDLKEYPPFDPELSTKNPPQKIVELRESISKAEMVIFFTPEYIFSIPSGLKNILEWCVSTTIFESKPVGIVTASTSGEMGHKELNLILQTMSAQIDDKNTLLISGVKGKVNFQEGITDQKLKDDFKIFANAIKGGQK